jgi:hypothetical protein
LDLEEAKGTEMLPHNDEQPAQEKDVELVSEDDEDPN